MACAIPDDCPMCRADDRAALKEQIAALVEKAARDQAQVERVMKVYAKQVEKIEALEKALQDIARVRYGLEQNASDEEAAEYWAGLCRSYREAASKAVKDDP